MNVDEFNNQIDQFTGAIAAVVVPITMIILVVGGIVVMNIMLVSVTERTFEVGLRKALGATRKQILLQFLIESALLCVVGGADRTCCWRSASPADHLFAGDHDDDNAGLRGAFGRRFEHHRNCRRSLSGLESSTSRPDRGSDTKLG